MADYLKAYNLLDVSPLLKAIRNFGFYLRRYGLDINSGKHKPIADLASNVISDAFTIPGISELIMFRKRDKKDETFIMLFNNTKDEKRWHIKIRTNITGGPS